MSEYTGDTLEELDEAARREAKSLLGGEPLRGTLTAQSQTDRPPASDLTKGGLRSVLRRAREHLRG